jgi:hypothetical protein
MDEENFFWSEPLNVDAIVANDGDEFLANADADAQGGENFYGQNQSLAGDAGWWDDNYPGQTVQNPDTVSDTGISVVLPGGSLQFENSAQYEAWSTNPQEFAVSNIGGVNTVVPYPQVATSISPTQVLDPYGLTILDAAQTAQITRNINPAFINNLVDPNSPTAATATNAVNKSATAQPAYVDQTGLAFDSRTGVSYPVDKASGKQLIPADVLAVTDSAAQVRLEMLGAGARAVATPVNPGQSNLAGPPDTFIKNAAGDWVENPKYPINISATPVNTGTGDAITAANQQTAAAAARLNAESPNPYLTNIDQAAAEISRGQDGIATSTKNIQTAQQNIATNESIIQQNNAELADPDISAERRAELEANNAAAVQNVFDQTQSINENQAFITSTQEINQFNEGVIDANSAGYRATTAGSNVPVVEVNSDPSFVGPQQITATVINPTRTAAPVDVQDGQAFNNIFPDPNGSGGFVDAFGNPVNADGTAIPPVARFTTAAQDSAIQTQVGRKLAQQQAVNAAQRKIANNGDWRVRLSLAPGARYLYNVDGDPGILQPLAVTGGVIFPYTPSIEMSYKADYESYALTHSNYKGYFYKSSSVDAVNMRATFTAQDSNEANYLLAVIHFFRSVTKMFYGQDAERGAPPPLVYLTGLGQYQFNGHPCVVTSFNYNLPGDVDYIRARSPNINGTDMLTRRSRQNLPTNPISGAVSRLQNLFSGQGISYGAEINRRPPPTLGLNNPTYVPTKLEISLSLLPVQTRSQVTNQFSLQQYATGALLGGSPGTSGQGGFW